MSVSCSKRGAASGLYAFVGVGRRTEHVRSVLLLHIMSGIIIRKLHVKSTLSESVLTK